MGKTPPRFGVVPLYMKRTGHEPKKTPFFGCSAVSIVLKNHNKQNKNDRFYRDINKMVYLCSIQNNQLKTFE